MCGIAGVVARQEGLESPNVEQLDKCFSRGAAGQSSKADNLAVVGVLSTQLVHDVLIRCAAPTASRSARATLVDRLAPVGTVKR